MIVIERLEFKLSAAGGGYGWVAHGRGGPWLIEDPGLALEVTQKIERHQRFICATELPRLGEVS